MLIFCFLILFCSMVFGCCNCPDIYMFYILSDFCCPHQYIILLIGFSSSFNKLWTALASSSAFLSWHLDILFEGFLHWTELFWLVLQLCISIQCDLTAKTLAMSRNVPDIRLLCGYISLWSVQLLVSNFWINMVIDEEMYTPKQNLFILD